MNFVKMSALILIVLWCPFRPHRSKLVLRHVVPIAAGLVASVVLIAALETTGVFKHPAPINGYLVVPKGSTYDLEYQGNNG